MRLAAMFRCGAGRILWPAACLSGLLVLAGGLAVPAVHAAGGESPVDRGAPAYIRMPQFSATLYRNGRPAGILSTSVLLEVHGADNRELLLSHMPRVRNQLVLALIRLAEAESVMQREYGPRELKRAFKIVMDRHFGPDVVAEVLIEGILRHSSGQGAFRSP